MLLAPVSPNKPPRLADKEAKAPKRLPKKDALDDALARELKALEAFQNVFHADRRHALLVVLQGRDASGKDGTIRKVFGACNPLGLTIANFRAPTEEELSHDFLWRVHQRVPAKGMIGIFNRSHYEDLLVVRVRGLVPESVWKRRYDQVNEFERMLAGNGTTILKFMLHISRDEQREELLERLTDPTKNWKFRAGDLDDRERWDDYTKAYRDVLRKCSTPWAPWYVVPSDSGTARNYLVARIVNETLRKMDLEYPKAAKDVLALGKELGKS